jgi:vWA-MoxR associated protein C-terminal domain
MAELLLRVTAPSNIFLFLDPLTNIETRVSELKEKGVQVVTSALSHLIEDFVRAELPKARKAGSRLLVHWSGHGFIQPNGDRIFVCRDYTAAAKTNCIFNAGNFRRNLETAARYQAFAKQILLADVCGVQSQAKGLRFDVTTAEFPSSGNIAEQVAFYATPETKYAHAEDGEGIFTRTARTVLADFFEKSSWPESIAFRDRLLSALNAAGQEPFWIEGSGNGFALSPRLAGSRNNALVDSIMQLFLNIAVTDEVLRPHYLRTVDELGLPELAKATELSEMVRELSQLQDETISGKVPFGLLQFLVRVSAVKGVKAPVVAWLKKHAQSQKYELKKIKKCIAMEDEVRILLIEVEHDEQGRLSGFDTFLHASDFRRASAPKFEHETVSSWQEFCDKLLAIVQQLRSTIKDFEIHFLVDLPLFDKAFHMISLGKDEALLGEEFVVILHHRERVRFGRRTVVQSWQEYAEVLRPVPPRDIKLHGVSNNDSMQQVIQEKGFCYTEFVIPVVTATNSERTSEKILLKKLLTLGVPYVYVLHKAPETPDWPSNLKNAIRGWLDPLPRLGELPRVLYQNRIGHTAYACEGTLLWDDPAFVPFFTTTEVKFL